MSMTEEEVASALGEYGLPLTALPYTRAEPKDGQGHPGDRVFLFPVELADGRYLAVSWMMGYPDADEMANCKLRWESVDGPFTRPELEAHARALR